MKKQLTFFLMFIALPVLVHAQRISGRVTSAEGPVAGASVVAAAGVGTSTEYEWAIRS